MRYRTLACMAIMALLCAPPAPAAQKKAAPAKKPAVAERPATITVLSIIPAQGEPGRSVTLFGTGFTARTSAFLGNMELPTRVLSPEQLTFDIPNLPPGLYALFLRGEGETLSRTYNFVLLPPKPLVTALTPDHVYYCSRGEERRVQISGRNFREGSQVVFDGAAIPGTFHAPEIISFNAPQMPGGLHQVQVRNSDDTASEVLGLFIDSKPEIRRVILGEERVNFYELIVEGRNFQQGSALVVMEESSLDQAPAKYGVDVKRIASATATPGEREKVIFIDCDRMIYQRYPYSSVPKSLRVQVVNPNGEESAIVQVSAP